MKLQRPPSWLYKEASFYFILEIVLERWNGISGELDGPCIKGLADILTEVCRNSKNPEFNRYVFDSVVF